MTTLFGLIHNMAGSMIQVKRGTAATSDNIANMNTDGYIAKDVSFSEFYGGTRANISRPTTLAKPLWDTVIRSREDAAATDTAQQVLRNGSLQLDGVPGDDLPNLISNWQDTPDQAGQLQAALEPIIRGYQQRQQRGQETLNQYNGQVVPAKVAEANSIYQQFDSIRNRTGENVDQLRTKLTNDFAKIAGTPVREITNAATVTKGEIGGINRGNNLVQSALGALDGSFNEFKANVNRIFGGEVIGGTGIADATIDTSQAIQNPIDFDFGNTEQYNINIGTANANLELEATTQSAVLLDAQEQFQDKYGVKLEEEITRIMTLHNHYAAIAEVIKTADEMLKTSINMVA